MNRYLPYLLLFILLGLSYFLLDVRSKQLATHPKAVAQVEEIKRVPTPTPTPYLIKDEVLWTLVNNWKFENDGYRYKKTEILCEYAEQRVKEIQTDYTHDGFYKISGKIYRETSIQDLGENLSAYLNEPKILSDWLNSPTHRKNLDENFTHSCIKCENNYCVQLFGKY